MKFRIFLVALLLAAQVAGIAFVSFLREREWRNNPTFRLQCTSYDPRDLLRGHYLPLDFKILDNIPFSKFDEAAQKQIRGKFSLKMEYVLKGKTSYEFAYAYSYDNPVPELWLVLAPIPETGLWEVERVTTSDPKIDFNANPQAGKIALSLKRTKYWNFRISNPLLHDNETLPENVPALAESALLFSFENPRIFFPDHRFYLAEEKAKEFDKKYRGSMADVSAELFLRSDGTPVIKRLFVNGEEF